MSIIFDKVALSLRAFSLSADCTIEEGHKIALLGPSGAGKSTLISALAGFIEPVRGKILFNGQDLTEKSPAERPVTCLFQDHNLFPHLNVFQNVGLGCRSDLKLSELDRNVVNDALRSVGLFAHADKMPSEISGGQQQRVALARALLRNQPILLLDEPFAALGPALKKEMLSLVDRIVEEAGATLLMVTHQPEDALHIADQTMLIAKGKAHAPRNTAELFADPPQALVQYLG